MLCRYGSDKPDTRFGLTIEDVTDVFRDCKFKVFSSAIELGGVVRCIRVPANLADSISNSQLKPKGVVFDQALKGGAKGLVFLRTVSSEEEPSSRNF